MNSLVDLLQPENKIYRLINLLAEESHHRINNLKKAKSWTSIYSMMIIIRKLHLKILVTRLDIFAWQTPLLVVQTLRKEVGPGTNGVVGSRIGISTLIITSLQFAQASCFWPTVRNKIERDMRGVTFAKFQRGSDQCCTCPYLFPHSLRQIKVWILFLWLSQIFHFLEKKIVI